MPASRPRLGRKSRILLAIVVALAVLVAAWDWNWFRHPVEDYFIKRSQRQVRIDDLHISFGPGLEPTVRLRGLYVENAPWADELRPFVMAGEVSFTFALRSIRERRPIVSHLRLVDADVDLERQADGHRNWRLRNPGNIGPGRMKVVHLEAVNSHIRFVRRDNGFEILATSNPLETPSKNAAGALTKRVRFEGRFNGADFGGDVETGDVLTIMESDRMFPLRGHMEVGKTRFDVDGSLANLFKPTMAEGKVRLRGPTLAALHPFLKPRLPATRPYEISAALSQEGDSMTAKGVEATFGRSVLTGSMSLDRGRDPPLLKANLQSDAVDLADLGWQRARTAVPTPGKPEKQPGPPARLFSDKPLAMGKLDALDADVDIRLRKIVAPPLAGLESLALDAHLEGGVLDLKPDIGMAEGHLRGTARMDARESPARFEIKLGGRDMRIEKMLAGRFLAGTMAGPVEAHADLKARGNSTAALAASLSGSARASLQNGVISGLLDATLKLDLGKILRALITGNKPIGVNRADIEFDFDGGRGEAKVFLVDTQQTRIVGTGYVDLREEAIDMEFTPHPVKKGLFALDSAIRVQGPMRKAEVGLEKK
jgi:AsmA family protein